MRNGAPNEDILKAWCESRAHFIDPPSRRGDRAATPPAAAVGALSAHTSLLLPLAAMRATALTRSRACLAWILQRRVPGPDCGAAVWRVSGVGKLHPLLTQRGRASPRPIQRIASPYALAGGDKPEECGRAAGGVLQGSRGPRHGRLRQCLVDSRACVGSSPWGVSLPIPCPLKSPSSAARFCAFVCWKHSY